MSIVDDYKKRISDQLNDIEIIEIDNRPLRKSDVSKLTDKQVIEVEHKKGFLIRVRKKYIIENFLNIPTVMYLTDKYRVEDELLGEHPVEFNAEDTAEYVNGLLGY